MIKILQPNIYTALNTDPDEYLVQNQSGYSLGVVSSDTEPASSISPDFIIESLCAVGNNHTATLVWGKPIGSATVKVGIVEG